MRKPGLNCLLIAFILVPYLVTGQTLRIRGQVVDGNSGEPLIGAHVLVQDKWSIGTMTDIEGQFVLESDNLMSIDSVLVSFIGYEEQIVSAGTLVANSTTIRLYGQTKSMAEVVVSAEKLIAEEFSVKKVEKLEIYMNPNAKADPLLAVNSLPAATTTDESANVSLRGSSPAETGVFFDNVPIYDAVRFSQLNGIGTFSIFNTAIVDNVQVFPGNPPLEFGNTTAGLIAIQSDEGVPRKNVHSAVVSLASLGYSGKVKVGEKGVFNTFTNLGLSAGLTSLNAQSLEDLKKFNSWDLGLHYAGHLTQDLKLKIFNYTLFESYKYAFRSPSFEGDFLQDRKRNFTVANLRYKKGSSEFTINQGLSFSTSSFSYSLTDIELGNDDFFTSANYQYFGEQLNIKTGLTVDRRTQDFDGTFPEYDFAQGLNHPVLSAVGSTSINVPEWYLYAKYYLSEHVTIGAGSRRNLPRSSDPYWSGQVNLSYAPDDYLNFHLSSGRYHKKGIGRDDDGSTIGQRIRSDQLSLDQNFKKDRLEQHFAIFVKDTELGSATNFTYGAELFVAYRFNSKFSANIAYTYINATVDEGDQSFESPYDLNYFIKGNMQYQFRDNWTLSSTFLFRQGQAQRAIIGSNYRPDLDAYQPLYGTTAEFLRLPGYKLVDVNVTKLFPIKESFTMVAFASASNVFNFQNTRSYRFNDDYSQRSSDFFSQRTFYFGVVLNF